MMIKSPATPSLVNGKSIAFAKLLPGSHVSNIYFPSAAELWVACFVAWLVFDFGGSGDAIDSNPVPPPGSRTKRLVIGVTR